MDARPALRNVDVQRIDQGDQAGVVLTDPLGISPEQVFVPEGLLPVVGRFDGQRSLAEIEVELAHASGQSLPEGLVARLAEQMDAHLFLDTPHFQRAYEKACAEFAAASQRASSHAGRSAGYPLDAAELGEALDSMVLRPDTGLLPTPRGLVAPHIDLARGREGYAMAYSALAECQLADLYVLFGTGHQGPAAPVTGLGMAWETPLGVVQTDGEFVAGIHRRLGPPDKRDLYLHRQEHSLEFQVLFLTHLHAGKPFQVAAFLTGHLPQSGARIDEESYVADLLGAFREQCDAARDQGRRVCVVAGADLAHIGPFFGDPEAVNQTRREQLDAMDLPRLQYLERGDPAGFFSAVESLGNPDRICGTVPMYLTASLAACPGRLLHYGQANSPDGSQAVSFCGMIFAE